MADAQISQSGPLFPNISLLDAKSFDFARWADFDDVVIMTRQQSSILSNILECEMQICIVPVHGFSAPKLDCRLSKFGRMYSIPEKTAKNNA